MDGIRPPLGKEVPELRDRVQDVYVSERPPDFGLHIVGKSLIPIIHVARLKRTKHQLLSCRIS